MRWVIVNEATKASALLAALTSQWLARCAAACEVQLKRDVAPVYAGGPYAVRVGVGPKDVQPGESVFAILDSLPDAPGAVAYHDVTGAAVPVAFLGLDTCQVLKDVSTAISHELVEAAGDSDCNLWADDGKGSEYARELCDAVESNSYCIIAGADGPIYVSDFLLPAFFSPGAKGPYSLMQARGAMPCRPSAAAFTTADGGYQLKRTAGANETQVTAWRPGKRGLIALAGKHSWASRPARRGLARLVQIQPPLLLHVSPPQRRCGARSNPCARFNTSKL